MCVRASRADQIWLRLTTSRRRAGANSTNRGATPSRAHNSPGPSRAPSRGASPRPVPMVCANPTLAPNRRATIPA